MRRILRALTFFGCVAALVSQAAVTPAQERPYDVLVAGGGAAGICAATAAARAGAKTLLVDQSFQVGGNMTSGLVNGSGLFFAWGEQVIAGIGYELVTNTTVLSGAALPDQSKWATTRHSKLSLRVNIPLFTAVCEEALVSAGVKILYFTSPAEAVREDDAWRVTLHLGGETRIVRAKELVDCTGDGSLAALAGARRLRETEHSPGTLRYIVANLPPRDQWPVEDMKNAYRAALADGTLCPGDTRDEIFGFDRFTGPFSNYIDDADSSTVENRTRTDLKGRAAMLRVYRFFKRFPAFKDIEITSCAAETGVRETYRVEGDVVVSGDDYVSGRTWEDAVCYSFYPIDLHVAREGVAPKALKPGTKPTVPYRALLAKGIDHLMMAGRCLSADRTAMAALRVTGTCMATGQVCGEAAAMAAQGNVSPRQVRLSELRDRLRAAGAIVP